jgi:tRNA-specific 2-thiouridylase
VVYVTTDLQDEKLWHRALDLTDIHWINDVPINLQGLQVRTRYRAELVPVTTLAKQDDAHWHLELGEDVRALTPGQSAVIYDGERVLGGGIVI